MTNIRDRSLDAAGRHLAWLEAGAGWPVILLHAFPLSAAMWRPQLTRVPQGWRFIAPDFRGFGQAPRDAAPGAALTMDDYARDVLALMDVLELEDAVIGGLSMGGYVTLAMYRQDPGRFTGMILADTKSAADTPQGREARVRLREVLAREGTSGVATLLLPKLLAAATREAGGEAVDHVRTSILSAAPEAVDAAIGALITRPDSTPGLPAIACATLIVAGEHDDITPPADAQAMQRLIPRSTFTVIPGAGHLSSLEQPDVFSRALSDFLVSHL